MSILTIPHIKFAHPSSPLDSVPKQILMLRQDKKEVLRELFPLYGSTTMSCSPFNFRFEIESRTTR